MSRGSILILISTPNGIYSNIAYVFLPTDLILLQLLDIIINFKLNIVMGSDKLEHDILCIENMWNFKPHKLAL